VSVRRDGRAAGSGISQPSAVVLLGDYCPQASAAKRLVPKVPELSRDELTAMVSYSSSLIAMIETGRHSPWSR
jgi:hypothetical protein